VFTVNAFEKIIDGARPVTSTKTDAEQVREIQNAMEAPSTGDLMKAIIQRAFGETDRGGSDAEE
jgi:hypothetical protein